ncbi:MAG: DUF4330 domain-containing protein [Candidatus Melainabacteria bacterium]|nr:DUF4330 domain-containing protein [Candidatus Melainabacteria bacterium]
MKRLNAFDTAVIVLVVLCGMGFGLARAGHAGVDKIIEGKSRIEFDVFLIGLKTLDSDLFKAGDVSAITIRNRPVEPPMKISKVDHWAHKASFLAPDGKSAVAFSDPALTSRSNTPIAYDYVVTLEETADRTKDGYVVSGNKIKIGNQVELEGFKYRTQGVVVDIREATDPAAAPKAPVEGTTGATGEDAAK